MTPQMMHKPFSRFLTIALLATPFLSATNAQAQDAAPPKAIIALVGDTDQFTIGQDGFCGKRNEVSPTAGAKFKIPANQTTYFSVRSKFRTAQSVSTCEGEYSFLPQPDLLYMIRYTWLGTRCQLDLFQSTPGATPQPAPVHMEPARSCLAQ